MTGAYTYVKRATAGTVTLSGLKERTIYQLFLGAYTIDTSLNGVGTDVYQMNVSTSSSLIGAFGNNLNIALFALLGMIIALLALNWIW